MPKTDRERHIAWRLKNSATISAKNKAYRILNLEAMRKKAIEYYQKNRERILRKMRSRYANDAEFAEKTRIKARAVAMAKSKDGARISATWRKNNPEKWLKISRSNYIRNRAKILARDSIRNRRRAQAMPPWVNKNEIEAIYEESCKRTRDTGVMHHVDHIMPLISKNLSGLHVPWNLQILTAQENWSKGNRVCPR